MTNSTFVTVNLRGLPPENQLKFWLAMYFTLLFHYGQKRRSGDRYANHPLRVATDVKQFGETCRLSALFHDIIEQLTWLTKLLAAFLMLSGYGVRVIKIVWALTKWSKNEDKYYIQMSRAISAGLWEVLVVKVADKIDIAKEPYNKTIEEEYKYMYKLRWTFCPFALGHFDFVPADLQPLLQSKINELIELCDEKLTLLKKELQPAA